MLTKIESSTLPVERFEADLIEVCGTFKVAPKQNKNSVRGVVRHEVLADLEVVHVAKDLNAVRRTKKEIAQDEGENFFLVIQEEGQALMSQSGSAQMLCPGDMILIDSAYPSEFAFFGQFSRQLSVHLPREEMLRRFQHLATGGKTIPKTDHTSIAIAAILAKAFQVKNNEPQAYYLKEAIFGLIGSSLYEKNSSNGKFIDTEITGSKLIERGMGYINQNFTNPELTIQKVADYLNVSIRQLQRAFTLIGSTPTDYLLSKRLELACQLLSARNQGEAGLVSTIAYQSGFNDISNFNKHFKKAFDCCPSAYYTN